MAVAHRRQRWKRRAAFIRREAAARRVSLGEIDERSALQASARDLARSRPLTWMDAAVAFFGYDPLAKALYRKLSVRFEEEVS